LKNANLTWKIFDLDGTLSSSNVSFAFGRFLYRRGFFSSIRALFFIFFFGLYISYLLPLKILHEVSFFLLFFKKKASALEALAREFVEKEGKELLRPEICKECLRAKEECGEDSVFIVSSSPDFLVIPMAAHLGVRKVFATSYKKDNDGRFCGIEAIVDGNMKRRYFEKDKKALSVYSDSIEDLPLLEIAKCPVATFPDWRLKRLAKHRGWRIIE
jgi:HAD superfamily phosphoserine phosphatase-like hydrolase